MPVVVVDIARPPDQVWRALTDATLLLAWLPGLRRMRVVDHPAGELPREILFEFAASLTYSLVYTYDAPRREVRWEPRVGRRDGVSGFARVDAAGDGARLTYSLEQGTARTAGDLVLGGPHAVVTAFVRWIEAQP
jgi:hypothetical protein